MLITNHVLSGALIGAVIRRPLPAFLAGVGSHFVLDAIPHWGRWGDQRRFLRVAVSDGLTGLTVMAALAAVAPGGRRRAAVVAGMAGAALPDLDKPARLWFGGSPWPAAVDRFHAAIQDEAPDRFRWEAAAAGLFAVSAIAVLRGSAAGPAGRPERPTRPGSASGEPVQRPLDPLL